MNVKVKVFKDIKNNRWTIYNYQTGKHLGYKKEIYLNDAIFEVIEEKRLKVCKTKHRFPHAWIIGTMLSKENKKLTKEVTYSPFKDKFFKTKNGNKVCKRKTVYLNKIGKVLV